jgi:hypothetical protein
VLVLALVLALDEGKESKTEIQEGRLSIRSGSSTSQQFSMVRSNRPRLLQRRLPSSNAD